MSKKRANKLEETITVNNEAAFSDALDEEYGTIILTGDVAEKTRDQLKKYISKKKISNLSGWLMLFGIWFWPLLFAGVIGKIASHEKINKYRVDIQEDNIILKHKSLK
ncbi:hypothetical protein V6615_03950 [Oscillospiraceae bacterium PP1C4]